MKNLLFTITLILFASIVNAQTWEEYPYPIGDDTVYTLQNAYAKDTLVWLEVNKSIKRRDGNIVSSEIQYYKKHVDNNDYELSTIEACAIYFNFCVLKHNDTTDLSIVSLFGHTHEWLEYHFNGVDTIVKIPVIMEILQLVTFECGSSSLPIS